MSTVNVADGFNHYSAEELINYANNGSLYVDSFCLSSLVEKILEANALAEYNRGYDDAEAAFDNSYCAECGEMM